jgi:hypothetical protein
MNALYYVVDMRDSRVVPDLIALLDPSNYFREQRIAELFHYVSKVGDERIVKPLVNLLLTPRLSDEERGEALWALCSIIDRKGKQVLGDLHYDDDPKMRNFVANISDIVDTELNYYYF